MRILRGSPRRLEQKVLIGFCTATSFLPQTIHGIPQKVGKASQSAKKIETSRESPFVITPSQDPSSNDYLQALLSLKDFGNAEKSSFFNAFQFLTKAPEPSNQPSTRLTLYRDGAVVNRTLMDQELHKKERFVISHLSSAVEPSSFVVHPPEGATVAGYWLESSEATSSDLYPQRLVLNVLDADSLKKTALWNVQYALNGISWRADHVIIFSEDRRHALFTTGITVQNDSGISFKDVEFQLVEQGLPRPQEDVEKRPSLCSDATYRYKRRTDLPAHQKRHFVWVQANHVTLTVQRGLFVGGKFLQRMEAPATPLLENKFSFPNIKGVGLGYPLPEGRVAIYEQKEGFSSCIGFSRLPTLLRGNDVTIRFPSVAHSPQNDTLEVQLFQENYREINTTLAEADYRLILRNLQADTTSLSITIDSEKGIQYSVARSNIRCDRNQNGEAVWNVEIPARETLEIRYKLTLKTG